MSTSYISGRKRDANRANALKSTGPKTAGGKAVSRFNAVTHGLRAETVVLPHEDAAQFEAERLGWIEDWKPESQTRMALVERAVAQSWRLRRCVRVETARLTKVANQAAASFDEMVDAWIAEGLHLLNTDPRAGVEALGDSGLGIQVLIDEWTALGSAFDDGPSGWDDPETHHGRLMNLLGQPADAVPARVGEGAVVSFRLLRANLGALTEGESMSDDERINAAAGLHNWTKIYADGLARRMESYPDPAIRRAQAIDAACIDATPEGLAHHRYEATHDRAFKATVGQLMQMARTNCDLIAPNEATDDANVCAAAACEAVSEVSGEAEPAREPRPTASAPNEATVEGPRTVGRDRDGRVWGVDETDPTLIN